MNSEKKNEIDADDGNSRVLKTREAAALAFLERLRHIFVCLFAEADMTIADLEKELDQSRSAHRCVLHLRGVGRITVPASILFARENRFPSTHNLAGGIITK